MPYVAPSAGPGGIIPRKKITKIKRDRPSASSSRFKRHAQSSTTTDNITNDLASTHLDESTSSRSLQPLTQIDQGSGEVEGGVELSTPQSPSVSHRSSFGSQSHAETSMSTRSPHPASVLSIPSLAGDTTDDASASIASPKQANIIVPEEEDEEGDDQRDEIVGAGNAGVDGHLCPDKRVDGVSPSGSSSASSPFGLSNPNSGAETPLTAATSVEDDHASSLARYKESLWVYTQGLYIQAKQRAQRRESIDSYTQNQFGNKATVLDKTAAKKARARRLSSFD